MEQSTYSITTHQELKALTTQIHSIIKGGYVIGLIGDLGSGKTTFTKYLGRTLGIKQTIISPTYIYQQEYHLLKPIKDITILVHIDLYRISSDQDIETLDLSIGDPKTVTMIEWVNKSPNLIRKCHLILQFSVKPTGDRIVVIEKGSL